MYILDILIIIFLYVIFFSPADSGSTEQMGERGLSGCTVRHAARPYGYWDVRVQFSSAHITLQTITASVTLMKKRRQERAREGGASSPVLISNDTAPTALTNFINVR